MTSKREGRCLVIGCRSSRSPLREFKPRLPTGRPQGDRSTLDTGCRSASLPARRWMRVPRHSCYALVTPLDSHQGDSYNQDNGQAQGHRCLV
jgi:hypothetical protein